MTEGMNVKDYDYDLPEELIAQDLWRIVPVPG